MNAANVADDLERALSGSATLRPLVVDLFDRESSDPSLTGSKAANLARCAAAGILVAPGIVVTTAATDRWSPGDAPPVEVLDSLRSRLGTLPLGPAGTVVVRSSSTAEDAEHCSMAGRFRSILDVSGWDHTVEALRAVRDSAVLEDQRASTQSLAVLIQPQISANHGGVLFSADPIQGDGRHMVLEVVNGGPSALVGGQTSARHLIVSRRGRCVSSCGDGPSPGRRELHALADLGARVQRLFHGPQDVEWATDHDGRVWLLQSRPITAVGEPPPSGPILGPGPVAETFPEPLRRLEVEAWLEPLRDGIARALRLTGTVSNRRLNSSPIALAVDGWAAVDLELLGVHRRRRRVLNPLTGMRRLSASWRVGRMRAGLPALAVDLTAQVDAHLGDVPPLGGLTDGDLVTAIANARAELVCTHSYEILAGMLLSGEQGCTPAPALALAALARARAAGQGDAAVIATHPIVLALLPPRYGGAATLPETPSSSFTDTDVARGQLGVRDQLRVRARWLQELGGRAMGELGRRLTAAGRLARPELVRDLGLEELGALTAGGPLPADLDRRRRQVAGPPLPSQFRLTPKGAVVSVPRESARSSGLGAGGGRVVGRVCHRAPRSPCQVGLVLVVSTLDPGLAAELPSLSGLVAESGSTLSHLAILARELDIPTVVGVPDARRRFPPGTRVLVDGRTGEVRHLAEAAQFEEDA